MTDIRKITPQEAYAIRKDVLRENIPLTEKMVGDFDVSTFHLGVFVKNELACVATFMQHSSEHFSGSQYRLRGMATSKKYQGKGLGKEILEKASDLLQEKDVSILWCNARVIAIPFYKKCGFEIIGNEFDVHLVGPHFVMYKTLKDAYKPYNYFYGAHYISI